LFNGKGQVDHGISALDVQLALKYPLEAVAFDTESARKPTAVCVPTVIVLGKLLFVMSDKVTKPVVLLVTAYLTGK
jgi:hypothetical protein